jgi:hypothetical protein
MTPVSLLKLYFLDATYLMPKRIYQFILVHGVIWDHSSFCQSCRIMFHDFHLSCTTTILCTCVCAGSVVEPTRNLTGVDQVVQELSDHSSCSFRLQNKFLIVEAGVPDDFKPNFNEKGQKCYQLIF